MNRLKFEYLRSQGLLFFFLFCGLEGVVVTFFLLQKQSEASSQLLGGVSFERLLFALIILFFAGILLGGGIYLKKNVKRKIFVENWLKRNDDLLRFLFLGISLSLFIFIFLVPDYRFGKYLGYYEQVLPALVWFFLLSLQFLGVLLLMHGRENKLYEWKFFSAPFFWVLLGGFLLVWLFIAKTGLGVTPDDRYWNEVGIPLLPEQILISLLGALSLVFLLKKVSAMGILTANFFSEKKDRLIFFFLWGLTAFFWIKEPLPKNFFAVGPYPPFDQYFPYVDAAYFDIGGQFALIGQGFFNGLFIDRALLSGILAFIHLFVGQDYMDVIAVQVILFSVFPALLYLLGTRLHSRLLGFSLAFLSVFKVLNAIASSSFLLSSHPKFFLTAFPTAMVLAFFAYNLVSWYRADGRYSALVAAGAALGIGVMFRTHLMLYFALIAFLALVKYWRKWKKAALSFGMFVFAFLLAVSPWMWRTAQVIGNPFFFLSSLNRVMDHRYSFDVNDPVGVESEAVFSYLPERAYRMNPQGVPDDPYPFSHSFVMITANHFSHNLVTSFLMLPTTPIFHDLKPTVMEAYPFWGKLGDGWADGRMSLASKVGVFFNLFLIAWGAYWLWRKRGFAAFIPLFVFLVYHAANAVARTSGGRYLVPVDWVLVLYYLVGLWEFIFFALCFLQLDDVVKLPVFGQRESLALRKAPLSRSIVAVLPFFLLVLSMPILEASIPQRYPDMTQEELVETYFPEHADELGVFLAEPRAEILLGRALHPRFYEKRQGDPLPLYQAFTPRDYSRLAFSLIGIQGKIDVMLPLGENPAFLPATPDVVVVGCRYPGRKFLAAYWLLVLDGEESYLLESNQEHTWTCP
jgi:hypothetical protein